MNTESPISEKVLTFELKGSLFTLTILQLLSSDLEAFGEQLSERVGQAPKFFENAPVVIDLQSLPEASEYLNFEQLNTLLREQHLVPIGVSGATEKQARGAIDAGLAILPTQTPIKEETTTRHKEKKEPVQYAASKVVTQPVRSGQQVYAKDGDLIVVGPVSHGAELLADGHIHVYGVLRGRALAGINGNKDARIFCHELDAELVSIAGLYQLSEDLSKQENANHIQIYLEEDQLNIAAL